MDIIHSFFTELAVREIKELNRFWDDLNYWERNNSIEFALSNMNRVLNYDVLSEDFKPKIESILEECNRLIDLNEMSRPTTPSRFKSMMDKLLNVPVPKENTPNARMCLVYISNLDKTQNDELCSYLGLSRNELHAIEKNKFDFGACSQAMFFAISRYLGKRYRLA